MHPQTRSALKLAAIVILAIAALVFVVKRAGSFFKSGEQNAQIWFYDLSEKRLYPVPNSTIPPHKGIGGKQDDGVRAIVVTFPGEQDKTPKLRIAYLETCGPELKKVMDNILAARAANRKPDGPIPSRESDLVQTNTLVKRVTDSDWSPSNTPEAQRIMSEWRSWRGSTGQSPVVSVPE